MSVTLENIKVSNAMTHWPPEMLARVFLKNQR
jgi:hypothetical protein